jgi:hypothetical protein
MKRTTIYLLLMLLTPCLSKAQQMAQHKESTGFARYLMSTGQSQLGLLEWERLYFHSPDDTLILFGYRDALRVERDFEKALSIGRQFLESNPSATHESILSIRSECARDAIWVKKYNIARGIVDTLLLRPDDPQSDRNHAWKTGINSLILKMMSQTPILYTKQFSCLFWFREVEKFIRVRGRTA